MSLLAGSRVGRLARKARVRGVGGVCRSIAYRLRWDLPEWIRERYCERRLGISTTGDLPPAALGLQDPDCHGYGPSRYGSVRKILDSLTIDPASDVFIDFGSGKGRVVVLAATYPFRRVVGVDPSSPLNEIARDNIERARGWMRCREVEIVAADAVSFGVPDDATVLYFANPFSGQVLERVLRNVEESLARAPRPIRVISHNHEPAYDCEQRIRSCAWLTMRGEIHLQRHTRAWVYVNEIRPAHRPV